MARLHEYQGKSLLADAGIAVPDGRVARTPEEAHAIAAAFDARVVIKIQAWVTGRAALGGVAFADDPGEAAEHARRMLTMRIGNFPVTELLVERAIDIRDELFVSLAIDDAAMAPVLLLDCAGGSGIEDRAARIARIPIDVTSGIDRERVLEHLGTAAVDASLRAALADAVVAIAGVARTVEARSLEVNPLVTTTDGRVVAADCRITIDDYAVFRHPELGIEIARELDHPATVREQIAYEIEQRDHRGTFYFAELPTADANGQDVIAFHGAGGGGSMMSMDAVTNAGFTLANFCDTSGNPSAAKVYRAARVILSQSNLAGYFGSGSGVASQEQYHSAYGLAKAFLEVELPIPAVIRLGGNSEDRAVDILEDACRDLPGAVEGYRKDDTPAFCAERFRSLVDASHRSFGDAVRRVPAFVGAVGAYDFEIEGGRVWIDHTACDATITRAVVERSQDLLRDESGKPVLAVTPEDVAKRDSELIALEIECRRAGHPVVFVDLETSGLEAMLQDGTRTSARRGEA